MDHVRHRLDPALVEGADLVREVRVPLGQKRDRIREGPAPILLDVPGGRAHLAEKPLHAVLVRDDLAVEMPRIPVEQHFADVEDDLRRVLQSRHGQRVPYMRSPASPRPGTM